jgi:putative addiction module antidote
MGPVALKLTTVGNSVGFIVPREVRERLGVHKGDTVYLTEAPDRSFRLTAHNPDFAEQMAAAREVMEKDKDILAALAKL